MVCRKNIILLLFLVTVSLQVNAQFYATGDDPSRTKWMEITSKNYRVIFPAEIDSLAKRYTFLLEKYRDQIIKPYNPKPAPIAVILHPYTTNSNGVVSWAPKRAEFYTSPPPYSGYSQNWEKQLVLHETRHIAQITSFTKGIYKYLHWFIGEQSTGIGVGVYPSRWFLESDAVIAETELSNSGRGRSAAFLLYYRTAFLQGDYRSWDKWRFGSYKQYTPDIYAFGYLINSTIRCYENNPGFPGDLFDYFVKHFYNPAVIRNGYREVTGATQSEYLQRARILMTSIWENSIDPDIPATSKESLKRDRSNIYTEYISPVPLYSADKKIGTLAIKRGYKDASGLILLDTLGRERFLRPFAGSTSKLQIFGNKIYWTETTPDLRWSLRTYSDLRSYDLVTKERRRLTNKEKYFNPSISPDGKIVAVTEYPVTGSSNLVLINSDTGGWLASIPAPENGQIRESAFVGDKIYATVITDDGIALYSTYRKDHAEWQLEIPAQFQTITELRSAAAAITFRSDLDGVNNLYIYKPDIRDLQRLTNSQYGAAYPYLDLINNELIYSDFDLMGYTPVKTDLDSLDWSPADFSLPYKHPVAELLKEQIREEESPISEDHEDIRESEYSVKPYRKLKNLINIHSWAPVYYNIDKIKSMSFESIYEIATLGAVAYSQNLLGTATTMLGYSFHDGFHSAHAKFTYTGLYPVFEIALDFNDRKSLSYTFEKNEFGKAVLTKNPTSSPLFSASLLTYIPFNLSSSGWSRGIIPQFSWTFNNDLYHSEIKKESIHRSQINYGVRFYQMRPVPKSSIFPRWGVSLSLFGATSMTREEFFGDLAYIYGYIYTPGVTKNQGIKITASYQEQFARGKSFYLSSYASMPRGFSGSPKMKFGKLSLDYAIPVYLGDISVGWFAYLQRLQLIPFTDIAFDTDHNGSRTDLISVGCDALIDAYFFRIAVPVSIGVRYSRFDEFNSNYFGFLFNIAIP